MTILSSLMPCIDLQGVIFISSTNVFKATSRYLLFPSRRIFESSLFFPFLYPLTSPFSYKEKISSYKSQMRPILKAN
eukprot:c28810_g1_i3 orf=10-240(-)